MVVTLDLARDLPKHLKNSLKKPDDIAKFDCYIDVDKEFRYFAHCLSVQSICEAAFDKESFCH